MEPEEKDGWTSIIRSVNWIRVGCVLIAILDLVLLYRVVQNVVNPVPFRERYHVMDTRRLVSRLNEGGTSGNVDGSPAGSARSETVPFQFAELESMNLFMPPERRGESVPDASRPTPDREPPRPTPSPAPNGTPIRGYRLLGLAKGPDGRRACIIGGPDRETFVLNEGQALRGTGIRVAEIDTSSVVLTGEGFISTRLTLSRLSSSARGRISIQSH